MVLNNAHLVVTPGVGHNEEAWLPESLLDLIGEGARSETAGDGMGASVVGKLQNGSLDHKIITMIIKFHKPTI